MSGVIALAGKILTSIGAGAAFADNLYHVFVPFATQGPITNQHNGQPMRNDHSTMYDVDGNHVWLRDGQYVHDPAEGKLYVAAQHALDMGLPVEGIAQREPPAVVHPVKQDEQHYENPNAVYAKKQAETGESVDSGPSPVHVDSAGNPVDYRDPQAITLGSSQQLSGGKAEEDNKDYQKQTSVSQTDNSKSTELTQDTFSRPGNG